MADILLVYGTTEGHTRGIAERIFGRCNKAGHNVQIYDATELPADLDVGRFGGVLVAASVHQAHYQSAVEHFAQTDAKALNRLTGAFVSISLNIVSDQEADHDEARDYATKFFEAAGWKPKLVHHAAGALRYSKYDFFKRWMMKQIARYKGEPTDTSKDYEFTDWAALDKFTDTFLAAVANKS